MQGKAAAIASYIGDYTARWPYSGVIQVLCRGEALYEYASGMACRELGIANTMDACFSLASVSKQFTAFAVMLLADQGLCDLDRPVNDYLPAELHIDRRITVHHLLSHTSGLRNYYTFEDDFFAVYDRRNYNQRDLFRDFISQSQSYIPGEKYEYCNAGYNMLAWMVEYLGHIPFGEFLRDWIFLPLGMEHTALDDGMNVIPNKAFLYTMDRNDIVRCPYYNEKFSIGAGAVVSNCADLQKWYHCLRDRQLLSAKAYERFFRENLNGYCYGLNHDTSHGQSRYSHGGDHLGIQTYVQYFFEQDVCILLLCNSDCNNQYRIGDALAAILFGDGAETSQPYAEVQLTEEQAQRYEGVYFDKKIELRRHDGRWEFVRFDGNLHIAVYPTGTHQFACRYYDRFHPYTLTEGEDGVFSFFGFRKRT
jgi:CubicO group peptidase (beta-lactamase class C family)